MRMLASVAAFGFILASVPSRPVEASDLKRSVSFELDKWFDLGYRHGPVTLHRIRVERKTGLKGVKSVLSRPTNSEFLQDVQIQIEYSNEASKDWTANLHILWVDQQGEVIDGYVGSEELGEKEEYELATVQVSTLRYGLDRARKLELEIEVEPD